MKFQRKQKHAIDLIFPIALFFVFAAACLVVLVMAAHIYSSTSAQMQLGEETYTPLSYIQEKFRQSDTDGGISVETIDNTDCLCLTETYEDASYTTYIYAYDNSLMELFISSDMEPDLSGGTAVMDVTDLTIAEPSDGLFQFSAADEEGHVTTLTLSERSRHE